MHFIQIVQDTYHTARALVDGPSEVSADRTEWEGKTEDYHLSSTDT